MSQVPFRELHRVGGAARFGIENDELVAADATDAGAIGQGVS